jgi:hypothetical protein
VQCAEVIEVVAARFGCGRFNVEAAELLELAARWRMVTSDGAP